LPLDLLPETRAILSYLSKSQSFSAQPTAEISKDQFKSVYKCLNITTSSSPSGHHLGHYKVATHHDYMASLHSRMMSIPFMIGFSPMRWRKVVDIMLEKTPGDPKIHCLT
jgi:hypothetical protein